MVNRGFECQAGQTKYSNIWYLLLLARHTALRRKSKYWLVRNQDNVSQWERYVYPRAVVSEGYH